MTTRISSRWNSSTRTPIIGLPKRKHPPILNSLYDTEYNKTVKVKVTCHQRKTNFSLAGSRCIRNKEKHSSMTKGSAMSQGGRVAEQPETYYLSSWHSEKITPLHAIHVLPSFLPHDICETIVREASGSTFTSTRHKHFPTVDVPLRQLADSYRQFYPFMHAKIYPLVKKKYHLNSARFNVVDLFVVRYNSRGQSELKSHRDGSIISFNIALNGSNQYTGGGTHFEGIPGGLTIRNERGGMLLHCGKIKHSGVKIKGRTSQRFILVGFLNVVSPCLVEEKNRLSLRSLTSDDEYLRGLYVSNTSSVSNVLATGATSITSPMTAASIPAPVAAVVPKTVKVRSSTMTSNSSTVGLLSCFRSRRKKFPQTLPKS